MKTFLQSTFTKVVLAALLLSFTAVYEASAQIPAGSYTISSAAASSTNYQNIASAIADLNGVARPDGGASHGAGGGVSGSGTVTFTISAGSETIGASAGGYFLNKGGTSSCPVVFTTGATSATSGPTYTINSSASGSGTLAPAGTLAQASTGLNSVWGDAFIQINGVSYVTFNGITLNEAYTGSSTTLQMEIGFFIVRSSATIASQNITISNNNITFYSSGTHSYSSANSFGIVSECITVVGSTEAAPVPTSTVTGVCKNNTFSGNVISNVGYGMVISGYAATTNTTYYDQNCTIGGTTASAGNTITNWGGVGASIGSGANQNIGIIANNEGTFAISNNTVNTGYVTSQYGLCGIYMGGGTTVTISNNKVYNLEWYNNNNNGNGTLYGLIDNAKYAVGGSMYIYDNIIGDLTAPLANDNTAPASLSPTITGLSLPGGTAYNGTLYVLYNTIYLSATAPSSSSAFATVAVNFGYTVATKDFRNNVIINTSTNGTYNVSYPGYTDVLYRTSMAGTNGFVDFTALNYNDYYTTGTNSYQAAMAGATGSPWTTFSSYQTSATTANANFENLSQNVNLAQTGYWANYTTDNLTNYLALGSSAPTTVTQGATPITTAEGPEAPSGVTFDWSDATRSASTPSMGAIEYVVATANAITTGTITGSPFCAGASVSVPFTNVGSGFTTGNTFTAVLSNSSGSFASGTTNIGTLSSTANSGTISATLPIGASTASSYMIEVVSSTPPATTLNANGTNLTINAAPTIAFGGLMESCNTGNLNTLNYSATGTPTQYSLAYNTAAHNLGFTDVSLTSLPSPITLAFPSIPANQGGIIGGNVTVQTASGCNSAPTPFTFQIDTQITFSIGSNPSVCFSGSSQNANLPYTKLTGFVDGDYYEVTWSNAATTAGFTNLVVNSNAPNPLSLTVPASAPAAVYSASLLFRSPGTACGGYVSEPFTLTVGSPPAPSTPGGSSTVCQASSPATYTTSATGATSYAWSVSGSGNSASGTGTTGTITWGSLFSGTATISVTATGACGTSTATTYPVTVTPNTLPTPSTPTGSISRCEGSGTTAFTVTPVTGATGYNWSVTGAGNSISGSSTTGTATWGSSFAGAANVSVVATNTCATSSSSPALTVYNNIMNGAYTIDNTVSGANNLYPVTTTFNSFASAMSALACGVSGPVTFSVAAHTYSEQVIIPATEGAIPGASATSTITFDGGSAATTFITSAGTGGNYAELTFNGCQYVTFKNLTITNTNTTNAFGVLFYANTQANSYNQLQNCTVNVPTTGSGANLNLYDVVFNASYTAIGTINTGNVSNSTVSGCTLNSGAINFYLNGFNGTGTENVITGNQLLTAWSFGLQIFGTPTAFKIRGNTIAGSTNTTISNSTGYCGIKALTNSTAVALVDNSEISGNIIYQYWEGGILLQNGADLSSSSYPLLVFNNFIGGGIPNSATFVFPCVYANGTTANVDFWFNTFDMNQTPTSAAYASLYLATTSNPGNFDVRNNIMAYTGASSSSGQPFYLSATSVSGSTVDYNLFYNAAGTNQANINGTQYTTSTVVGGGGFNTNSHVTNPFFVSTNVSSPDLHITDQCTFNRGITIPSVTTDIDNQARLSPPNVGADEIPVTPGPTVVVTPNNAVCTGTTSSALVASGAVSYTWSPITNLTPSAGTSATETAQISALTIYTVTGTGANGCTANTTVPVATVAVGGTISAPYSIICSGGTKTLSVLNAAGNDYQWQISTDNSTWTNISGATNTTYTTASSDGNSNKFYRLLALSNSCWNVASTTAEVDVSIPNIAVTTTNLTDNSLTLNWSPVGSGNYSISYSGPSSATFTSVTPSKTITGLTANGNYSVTVTQTGVSGCAASGTLTGVNTLCAMPTGVTLNSPAPAQIQVSWNGVGGADYRVYYRPLFSYNTYFTQDVSNASSVLITKQGGNNLYASTTYEVYVSRLDCPTTGAVGQGTSPTNVTTLPTVSCATPQIDSVRSLCPVQLEVFIHDNGVNQYNVFIQRISPSILAVNSYGVSGTYFTINTPYSGDQFLIAVEARCGSELSAIYVWPGNVTIKPLCNAPSNLVLSNPTCSGFTASWNDDQCLSNSASGYDLYMRVAGTINYNSYGAALPVAPVGPNRLVNWASSGRTYQVFVRSIYNCNGFVTYGPTSQVETITTLSSGCRDEDAEQPQENKPAVQQYSTDNSEVFSLYPNPNTGKFVVDLSRLSMEEDAVRIEVFNMLGQTVVTDLTTISGGQLNEYINLPNGTATGTYIVRLTAGKNVYTTKVNISR